jgi:hypothetical protein
MQFTISLQTLNILLFFIFYIQHFGVFLIWFPLVSLSVWIFSVEQLNGLTQWVECWVDATRRSRECKLLNKRWAAHLILVSSLLFNCNSLPPEVCFHSILILSLVVASFCLMLRQLLKMNSIEFLPWYSIGKECYRCTSDDRSSSESNLLIFLAEDDLRSKYCYSSLYDSGLWNMLV